MIAQKEGEEIKMGGKEKLRLLGREVREPIV